MPLVGVLRRADAFFDGHRPLTRRPAMPFELCGMADCRWLWNCDAARQFLPAPERNYLFSRMAKAGSSGLNLKES
jgi:hypothetical protein